MTVTIAPRYKRFNGNDTTGPFSFTFPILLSNSGTPYITVKRISASGEETTLAYPADYTFSALLLGKGGGIITTIVMVATGEQLFVEATTPLDQQISFRNQGEFSAESHENGFDKVHFILIESVQKADLSIKFPSSEIGVNTTLPIAAQRANTSLGFDASGDILCGSLSSALVSAAMTPVVQGATLADARTAMGLGSAATQASTAFDASGSAAAALSSAQASSVQKSGDTMTGNLNVPSVNGGQLAGFRNRIINGDMTIDQRNVYAEVAAAGNIHMVDRWKLNCSVTGKFNTKQNKGAVTPPVGFRNYLGITTTSAYTPAAGEFFTFRQVIEGYNVGDFMWGTANAKTVTLSFWVYSSMTGLHSGALRNAAATRSYPFSFNINAANTWEYKTITVAGCTDGVWDYTNSEGVIVYFSLGTGATYRAAAGAWANGSYVAATGSVNPVATLNTNFFITGVQFEEGSTATPFERRNVGTELLLCQRYYCKSVPMGTAPNSTVYYGVTGRKVSTTNDFIYGTPFPVTMRVDPTITYYSPATGASGVIRNFSANVDVSVTASLANASRISHLALGSSPAAGNWLSYNFAADAEL